jgi:hypothetical protein
MNIFNSLYAGKIAGNVHKGTGYINSCIDSRLYKAHRLIWKLYYGEDPNVIDHINGIKDDNRICNLRSVTTLMNNKNQRINKNNKSGYSGVHYCEKVDKWQVLINDEANRTISLGVYNTEHLAALARELKFREIVGEDFYNESGRDAILQSIQDIVNGSDVKYNNNLIKRNTSGYTGVRLVEYDRYKSTLCVQENGKSKALHLGYYNTAEEAALVRELKLKELKGDEYYTIRGRDGLLKELEEKVKLIKNT